jgi:hypothetical protein
MERYRNISGRSNVASFRIDSSAITIQFKDGSLYLYNEVKPGKHYVDRMKQLAIIGNGLNGLISSVIKKNYYAKLN